MPHDFTTHPGRFHLTTFLLSFLMLAGALTVAVEARSVNFKSSVNAQVAAARRIAPELGVEIYDLSEGRTVYSFNHETRRIIASNTKLFTTAAALDRLGPGFFFETKLLIRGTVRNGTLEGDLAIVGGGDPNLSGRHYNGDALGPFREWAWELRRAGIERVSGDVVLVDGLFDREWVHPDWPKDQVTRWYEAPVSALSFSDNCVLVKVQPAARAGQPAIASTVPELDLFEITNSARTTARSKEQWLAIDRERNNGLLKISGKIYRRTESYDKWISVADPVRYFGAALQLAFSEEGVTMTAEPRAVKRLNEADWRPAWTHRSDLLTTIEVINKRSQNFYAESVIKLLGAKFCDEGSWRMGTRVVKDFLTEIGIEDGTYRLADGSGMSRNNRFTPRQLVRLLEHMYSHPWSKEFLASLPYSGERDLRWEKRLAEDPYRGNVLAKTGSLNSVSTLSGYAKARSGKVYAFSILCNASRSGWRAKGAQDAILRALIDHG